MISEKESLRFVCRPSASSKAVNGIAGLLGIFLGIGWYYAFCMDSLLTAIIGLIVFITATLIIEFFAFCSIRVYDNSLEVFVGPIVIKHIDVKDIPYVRPYFWKIRGAGALAEVSAWSEKTTAQLSATAL